MEVLHSKSTFFKARLPGEIRANAILCLQVGHISRSALENELRITPPQGGNDIRVGTSVRFPTFLGQYSLSLGVSGTASTIFNI